MFSSYLYKITRALQYAKYIFLHQFITTRIQSCRVEPKSISILETYDLYQF